MISPKGGRSDYPEAPTADGLVMVGREGQIIKCNRQASLLLGKPHTQLVGQNILGYLPAEFQDAVRTRTRLVTRTKLRDVECIAIYEPLHGKPDLGVVFLRDIHQESRLLQQVRRLQAKVETLRNLLEGPPTELWVMDGQGRTLHITNLYGIPESELLGRNVKELEDERLFYPSIGLLAIKAKKPVTAYQEIRSGRRFVTTANPVFDAKGDVQMVMNISREVTDFFELKEVLRSLDALIHEYMVTLEQVSAFRDIVAAGPAMKEVIAKLRQVAPFDSTVLLLGETGTGKDTMARLLHALSPRGIGPFIKVNCGAIPETLMESEFFGYAPGAFTGAQKRGKKGLVELAHRGTLFLDEVGTLPYHLQVKLLHLIQEREFLPVGGTEYVRVDVRFVAATNEDLEQLVREGKFREDLYYRLNVVPIVIPPLRDRREEIPLLVRNILTRLFDRYGVERKLDDSARDVLLRYDWPGNIRELENILERCFVTCPGDVIDGRQIFSALRHTSHSHEKAGTRKRLSEALADLERELLTEALAKYGSTRKAAAHLGISQSTVVRKMRQFGLPGA